VREGKSDVFPRLHLSTALILLLLAAGILYLNAYRKKPWNPAVPHSDTKIQYSFVYNEFDEEFGWPARAATGDWIFDDSGGAVVGRIRWYPGGMGIDAAVALTILATAGYLLERRARRKA